MYEMDIAVRNLLLRELKKQFGQERLEELGAFLIDYVAQRLTADDPDTQDLAQAQEWTALAYTKPDEAARKLAEALSVRVKQQDIAEVFRLTSLVETLVEPLVEAGFEPLLVYSRGMNSFVRNDITGAAAKFSKVPRQERQLQIAGISLQIPQEIVSFRNRDISGHYSTLRTRIDNAEILKTVLRSLGLSVKTNAEVRANTPKWVRADIVAVLEGNCDLGWSRNQDGTFDMIADLWCVAQKHNQTELINSINQKYSATYREYLDDSEFRKNYLARFEQPGTSQIQKDAILVAIDNWLEAHPENLEVLQQYLKLIEIQGASLWGREKVIARTITWLQNHPDDTEIRKQYLALVKEYGTEKQLQEVIAQSSAWLQAHPDDTEICKQYLALVKKHGTEKQLQEVIAQSSAWLQVHSDDTEIRKEYLPLLKKYRIAVTWTIQIASSAQETLDSLDNKTKLQITRNLELLKSNPLSKNLDVKKIKEDVKGLYFFRLRMNIRVVYQIKIEEKVIQILDILFHQSDI
jgi:mRNA-degrading endonuclease RelE of RelBE toxin-antitoxin system